MRVTRKRGAGNLEAMAAAPRTRARRVVWVIAIVSITVVVAVTLLATVPVPHTSSFSFSGGNPFPPSYFDAHFPQTMCPGGAKAVVSFSSNGLDVTFGITAPNYVWVWSQHSAYANVSFVVPACGTYQILANGTGDGSYSVDGTLTYSAPLL